MKRIIALALTAFALAAVPVAFGDDGSTLPDTTASAASQDQGQQGQRLQQLRLRIQTVERRFAKHCGTSATGAPQQCLDFAGKVKDRLAKVDENVQARIAKIQQTCGATNTDQKCTHAADRIALLQKVDEHVKALAQKVQDWLDGKTVSAPTSSDRESALDQAAAGLGRLAGVGG
jgi:hypothetical protein